MAIETYGNYQLLRRLATGGMAQIYLARQKGPEGFEKLLVVKRILPHLAENEEFVRMFLDEARIAARLNHPNIVQIFNLGAQDDTFFIAMEYIHGEDVRRVWKHADACGKSMPFALVCRVIIEACAGLDYAHKKADQNGKPLGIVHRDISPQNILVSFEGGVKVVDFGIAKAADQATVTKSGVLKGKYSYMSPEQASGKKVDCRSDIFALGIVLHELLTGQRLFKRANEIQTLHAVTDCQVPLPSSLNPQVPTDLDRLVMKALSKRPDDRYSEAVELAMALEQYLLERRLPSSTSHLAAFMQDLYADRLAEEKRAGTLLLEDSEPGPRITDDELIPPTPSKIRSASMDGRLPGPRARLERAQRAEPEHTPSFERMTPSSPSLSRSVPQRDGIFEELINSASAMQGDPKWVALERNMTEPGPDGQATVSLDSMAPSLAVTSASEATDKSVEDSTLPPSLGRRRLPLATGPFLLTLLALGAVGLASYFLATRKPNELAVATVIVRTDPLGAKVVFNGKPVAEPTPCRLPAAAAGAYSLELSKDGFKPYETLITVPDQGTVQLPVIALLPEPQLIDAGANEPSLVELTIRSEPVATLWVNGNVRGKTPQVISVLPNSSAEIRLEKPGYAPVARGIQVGDQAREEVIVLEPATRSARGERPERRKNGRVRFAVTPWANVACGTTELGQTPLKDVDLPAGTYQCTFTNPDFPPQRREVVVLPNDLIKVSVKF